MSFARSCAVVACVTALLSQHRVAVASTGWDKASLVAAKTYFPAATAVMIVGVGSDAQPVAAALLESLQSDASFELVIDAAALGKLDGLADDEIVRRAFTRPITRVAIVRVFPAAGSVKAVVTVYGAQAQVTTAFTLAPGKILVENPIPQGAGDGVRRDEMLTVKKATEGPGGPGAVTYKREHIVGVSNYGVVTFENVSFFRDGKLITDTPSLYEALGMTARASKYRSELATHERWAWRGGLMALVGLTGLIGFGTWALIEGAGDYGSDPAEPDNSTTLWALTAGSAALLVGGGLIARSHPRPANLSGEEGASLVDAHNAKQRNAASTELRFAPSATPAGPGFVLSGTF
jgi:hypothetical protein